MSKMKKQMPKVKQIAVVTKYGTFTVNPQNLEELLRNLYSNCECHVLSGIDMHHVLDCIDEDKSLDLDGIRVCISWVNNLDGKHGKALIPNMQARIQSGQINFGIICCKRGKKGKVSTEPGSKADIIRTLMNFFEPKTTYFFDDAQDHVNSVKSLEMGVKTYLVPKDRENKEVGKVFLEKTFKKIQEVERSKVKQENASLKQRLTKADETNKTTKKEEK